MNLLQDSISPEHHVMKCAFHHHDAEPKRKMLGGVSFDGGSAAKERHTVSQAGEQKSQPPFSDINFTGIGDGIDRRGTVGRGTSGNVIKGVGKAAVKAAGHQKDTVSISGMQNQNKAETAAETLAVMQPAAVEIADVIENKQPARKSVLDYKKYMGKISNGIQTFLKGMEQKAGKENKQQPQKKKLTGTRAVTKEEVYEIKINTAYLLDSYNKHGERSTLGQ